jgi:hypothetical protein
MKHDTTASLDTNTKLRTAFRSSLVRAYVCTLVVLYHVRVQKWCQMDCPCLPACLPACLPVSTDPEGEEVTRRDETRRDETRRDETRRDETRLGRKQTTSVPLVVVIVVTTTVVGPDPHDE